MKKGIIFSIISACLLVQSCSEKGIPIDLAEKKEIVDSTYVAPVEIPQNRNVFIEEFTGASCVNCPQGHEAVAALIDKYQERIVAVAYHTFNGGGAFKPVKSVEGESKYDFRDSSATNITSLFFGGLNSIPNAGLDRVSVNGSLQVPRLQWTTEAEKRLPVATPANLYLTSAYNSTENKVRLKIKIAYTKNVTGKNILTIGVAESGIIDAQLYSSHVDVAYVHNHIFRGCITPFYGKSVLDSLSTKEAGRVYEYNYSFTPAVNWKIENCKVIALLSTNEPANKEVLQATEVNMK